MTVNCLCIRSFFSICSIGNCGTSYGAEISLGNSCDASLKEVPPPVPVPPSKPKTGLSLPTMINYKSFNSINFYILYLISYSKFKRLNIFDLINEIVCTRSKFLTTNFN